MKAPITLSIASLVFLTGCVARFSETNYDRMVHLVVDTRDPQIVCATPDTMRSVHQRLKENTIHALEHSAGRSRDGDIHSMLTNLMSEIDGFGTRLGAGNVSQFYCREKIKDINTAARLILRSEGSKPRT